MPDGLAAETKRGTRYRRRRQDVEDAAASVFADKGYHGASTTDIATRAGIAQSSLYYYMASKDAALEAVCQRGIDGYLERLAEIAAAHVSQTEKLRRIIEQHIRPARTISDYVKCFHRERRYLPPDRRVKIAGQIDAYNTGVTAVLAAGAATGEFRPDIDYRVAAVLIISQCNAAQMWLGRPDAPSLEALAGQIYEISLQGVGGKAI